MFYFFSSFYTIFTNTCRNSVRQGLGVYIYIYKGWVRGGSTTGQKDCNKGRGRRRRLSGYEGRLFLSFLSCGDGVVGVAARSVCYSML